MTLDALGTIQCVSEVDTSGRESGLADLTMEHVTAGVALALQNGWIDKHDASNLAQLAQKSLHGAWGALVFLSQSYGNPMTLDAMCIEPQSAGVGVESSADSATLVLGNHLKVDDDVREAIEAALDAQPMVRDFPVLSNLLQGICAALVNPAVLSKEALTVTSDQIEYILVFGVEHGVLTTEQAQGLQASAQHPDGLLQVYEALWRDFHIAVDLHRCFAPYHIKLVANLLHTHHPHVTEELLSTHGDLNLVTAFVIDRIAQVLELAAYVRRITRADLCSTRVLGPILRGNNEELQEALVQLHQGIENQDEPGHLLIAAADFHAAFMGESATPTEAVPGQIESLF